MILSAVECFKKNVNASDGSLGLLVNLLFDRESLEARIVVFPKLKSTKRLEEVARSLGSLGASALSTASYGLYDTIGSASSVVSDITYEGVRKAEQKIYDRKQEIATIYFLIPASEISSVEDEDIKLELDSEEYELYRNMRGTQNDLAFFNDEMFRESERYTGISLNMTTVRGLNVKDAENRKGRIIDILFDPYKGVATHFVVKTIGKGAKPRMLDFNSFDLNEMKASKNFVEYPTDIKKIE
jgi:hypothetical protein